MCRVAERLGCLSATVKRRAGEPLTDRLLARVAASTGCLYALNGGSSPEVSPAAGARIASPAAYVWFAPVSGGSWSATACPFWRTWTGLGGCRCQSPGRCAMRGPLWVIWFMWTSRNSDASATAAVGVSTAESLPRAAQQARGEAKPLEHERQAHAATATSTTLLTTIPRWCTQRSLTTNAIRAQRDSEPAPTRSSTAWA